MKYKILIFFLGLLLIPDSPCLAKEPTLPDTLVRIKPSIVAVGTYLPSRIPRELFLGTGFAVANGRTIVTNAHVTERKLDKDHLEQYAVYYRRDNKEFMLFADIAVIDNEHDIVLLSLNKGELPALELGDSHRVREGEPYAFTGYPIGQILGLFAVTHRCIISAITPNAIPAKATPQLNVNMVKRLQAPYDVFQLDATAYPGNSGSPLYDENTGRVVGIVNKVFVQGTKENALSNPSGISYAIPAEYIKSLLEETKTK